MQVSVFNEMMIKVSVIAKHDNNLNGTYIFE